MSRPPYRSTPTPAQGSQPRRSRARRVTRMTVGVTLLLAVAAGVTVGAAAYSRNAAADNAAIAPAAVESPAEVRDSDVARSEQEARDLAEQGQSREVIPGLAVKIGDLRTFIDPSGLPATTLPLQVVNTGSLTRTFDITVVAISDKGEVITTDVGTAANLRPGQSAQVQVLEIVDNVLAEQLSGATFRVEEAYAY
ncbi:MAG TPA: hypothetical protein VMZ00_13905 [Sporichthya sp.]|nr:hypothetical protein [Sporichthya sp.]